MTTRPMQKSGLTLVELAPWTAIDFGLALLMWAVMMAAMMLPSAIPMALTFARICQRQQHSPLHFSLVFVLGYFCVWLLFSILLTILQWQMHNLAWLSPMLENKQPLSAAAILIVAGIYQFSAVKNTCLKHCRSPLGFLLQYWHADSDVAVAFTLGLRHGSNCLGCCWAEMLIMLAVGIMNLLGMAMITLLILLEKMLPVNAGTICRISGCLFIAWGCALLITF